jgi:hypothetical protein
LLSREFGHSSSFCGLEGHSSLFNVVSLERVQCESFKGCEISVVELKLQFYHSLMDSMSAIELDRFFDMLEFLDYCSF